MWREKLFLVAEKSKAVYKWTRVILSIHAPPFIPPSPLLPFPFVDLHVSCPLIELLITFRWWHELHHIIVPCVLFITSLCVIHFNIICIAFLSLLRFYPVFRFSAFSTWYLLRYNFFPLLIARSIDA